MRYSLVLRWTQEMCHLAIRELLPRGKSRSHVFPPTAFRRTPKRMKTLQTGGMGLEMAQMLQARRALIRRPTLPSPASRGFRNGQRPRCKCSIMRTCMQYVPQMQICFTSDRCPLPSSLASHLPGRIGNGCFGRDASPASSWTSVIASFDREGNPAMGI